MKKLTDKQELYAQLVVKYGSQSQAYREAYNVKETTKDSTVWANASKLMSNTHVLQRVEEIRENLKQSTKIDREWIIAQHQEIIDWYKELKQLARREDLDSADIKRVFMLKELIKGSDFRGSLDSITKMLGLNEAEKIENDIKIEIIEKKRD